MKKGFNYILIVLLTGLLVACSTKKNTWASRSFHAFNTRYNVYYNGKTSFDEALVRQNEDYVESYTGLIHMFPISAFAKEKETYGGPFDRAIEKGSKAIRLHSIQVKPAKKPGWRDDPKQVAMYAKEEYNPFLKHCWMLIAKSQFHNADFLQASSTFSYIARHYRDEPEVVAEARLWRSRCYAELDWRYEAELAFKQLVDDDLHTLLPDDYHRFYADYLLKSNLLSQALPYLQQSIKAEKNKRQKVRLIYLLGQVHSKLGQQTAAYEAFRQVSGTLHAPRPIRFAADMRQAEVIPKGEERRMLKKLKRMSRSEKNSDWLDQVYTARGDIFLSLEDTTQAINSYRQGIREGALQEIEKAICMVRLADLYFDKQSYSNAQPYYNAVLPWINKDFPNFTQIVNRSEILDKLVVHIEVIQTQDSLQRVALLPEEERMELINQTIKQRVQKEKAARKQAEKEAYLEEQEASAFQPSMGIGSTGNSPFTSQGDGSFYFYNPLMISQGKAAFQSRWGRRPLEDHWRRREKELVLYEDKEELTEDRSEARSSNNLKQTVSEEQDSLALDPYSSAYYLQQLPLSAEERVASDQLIANALYQLGMIYKNQLENYSFAKRAFDELEERFPQNAYRLEYFYQEYLMALRLKDETNKSRAKNNLITSFPETDYARWVANPNFEHDMQMQEHVQDSIYQLAYADYLRGDTLSVRQKYRLFGEHYPQSVLMPKLMFLNALSYVQSGDANSFKNSLKKLIEKYPTEDVSDLGARMMKGLLGGKQIKQETLTSMTWNLRLGAIEGDSEDAEKIAFKDSIEGAHRLLLLYPLGKIDENQLLFTVGSYNFSYLKQISLDLSFEEATSLKMLVIDGFNTLDEVLQYYTMIYEKEGYAQAIDSHVSILPISMVNYQILMRGKTQEEYVLFFGEHYGEKEPRVAARWEARIGFAEENSGIYSDPEPPYIISGEAKNEPIDQTTTKLDTSTRKYENHKEAVPKQITLESLEERRREKEELDRAEKQAAQKLREQQLKSRKKELKEREKARKASIKQREQELKAKRKAATQERKKREKERKRQLKELEKERR